jgi:hypothetical protein
MDITGDAWFDDELAGCNLADERLNKRLRKLLAQFGGAMGQSIPLVCQDWANKIVTLRPDHLLSRAAGSARSGSSLVGKSIFEKNSYFCTEILTGRLGDLPDFWFLLGAQPTCPASTRRTATALPFRTCRGAFPLKGTLH